MIGKKVSLAFTVLCLSIMSTVTANASSRKDVLLKTNGLSSPAKATQSSEWMGDRLYLGTYPVTYDKRDSEDILWDVLDPQSTCNGDSEGVYALSTYSIDRASFNPSDRTGNTYVGSNLERVLTAMYEAQDTVIKDSILPTNETDATKYLDYQTGGNSANSYGLGSISDALLFPPSAYDLDKASYGFYHIGASVDTSGDGTISRMSRRVSGSIDDSTNGKVFWTRSPYLAQTTEAGAVAGGIVTAKFVSGTYGVAPAMNLNNKRITYMADSQKDKNRAFTLNGALSGEYGEWRVALKDTYDGKFDAALLGLDESGNIKINIKSNANMRNSATQISAILTDNQTGTAVAYGKIADAGVTGNVLISKPANIPHGEYRLYLFDECVTPSNRGVNFTSNLYGDSDAEKMIIDYGALKFVSQPQSLTVTEGEDADFSITAKNAEAFKWQFSLEDDIWKDFTVENGVNFLIANDWANGISSCKVVGTTIEQDGMVIRCLVTGNGGQDYSSEFAILTVNPDLSKKSSSSELTTSSSGKVGGKTKPRHHKKGKKSSSSETYYGSGDSSPAPVAPDNQYIWTDDDWANYNKALAILAYNNAVKKDKSAASSSVKHSKKSSSSSSGKGTSSSFRQVIKISANRIPEREEAQKIQLRKPKHDTPVIEPVTIEPEVEKESIWSILWAFFMKIWPWLLILIIIILIILIIRSMFKDKNK